MRARILQGTMPNGELVLFQENRIDMNGNCGFIALGIEREMLVNKLMSFSGDFEVRKRFSEEIKGALMAKEFLPPKVDAVDYERYLSDLCLADNCLNRQLAQTKSKHPIAKDLEKDALISWLRDQPSYIDDFNNISRLNLEAHQADQALQLYCQKKEVFEAYAQAYYGKMWLGYESALFYAEKENISLYIWVKESGLSTKLKLKDHRDCGDLARNEIHALHTNGFTHFNLLSAPDVSHNLPNADVNFKPIDRDTKTTDEDFVKPGYLTSVTLAGGGYNNLPADPDKPFWKDIPMFSVITGKNGTGKTSLLNAILFGFEKNQSQVALVPDRKKLEVFSFQNTTSITSLRSSVETDAKSSFEEELKKDFEQLRKYSFCRQFNRPFDDGLTENKKKFYNYIIDESLNASLAKDKNFSVQLYEFELKKRFDRLAPVHISGYSSLEIIGRRILENVFNQINPDPVSESDKKNCLMKTLSRVNGYLKHSGFKYRFSEKCFHWNKNNGEFDKLELSYEKSDSSKNRALEAIKNNTIMFGSLSSGERLELLLLLWRFERRAPFKETVLLMDEPDAHLHPSLMKEIIDIIKTKVIQEWGIQVIMTTHSPTTVSLVPKDCLWVLQNESPEYYPSIRKAESKKEVIQLLTSEFVCVNEPFRLVFVEALDDKKFYQAVLSSLIAAKSISHNEQILFMAHSKDKTNSSCDLVRSIVENCVEDIGDEDKSLREYIFGIVDGDNKAKPASPNIFALERYSIENYIYDPIYLFFSVKMKCPQAIKEIEVQVNKNLNSQGLKLPRSLDEIFEMVDSNQKRAILQCIIDELTNDFIPFVEAKIIELDKKIDKSVDNAPDESDKKLNFATDDDFKTIKKLLRNDRFRHLVQDTTIIRDEITIKFVGGIQLRYPRFILEMRGHALEYLYSRFFAIRAPSKKNIVDKNNILGSICKQHMFITTELETIFKALQAPLAHFDQVKSSQVEESKILDLKQTSRKLKGAQEQIKQQDQEIRTLKEKLLKSETDNKSLRLKNKSMAEKLQEHGLLDQLKTVAEKSLGGNSVLETKQPIVMPSVFVQPQHNETITEADLKEPDALLKTENN